MTGERLAITLLGSFSVAVDGRAVPDGEWHLRRAADLVKLLALAPQHRLPRDEVIDALWPDAHPEQSATSLRKVAFQTRHALGLPDGIVLEDGLVKLAPGHSVRSDRDAFVDAATRALASGEPAACRAAAAEYGGELLPDDHYAAWCEQERRYLRGLFRELLDGGQLWGRLVHEDLTNERAHREIMRAQLERGDRAGAIRQFELLRTTLREELGVSPDQETVALYDRALTLDGRDAPTPAERARALLAWGMVHWQRSDLEEAERTAAEARALAIDAGLPRELTEASELLGLVAHVQGNWHQVFADSFLQSLSSDAGLAPFVVDANICLSEFVLWEQSGLTDIADLARKLLQFSESRGSPQAEALGRLMRGETALLSGLVTVDVHDDLARAARLHQEAASSAGWALSVERLAQFDSRRGDQERAREEHRLALRVAGDTAVPEHLIPLTYGGMLQGETVERARDAIDEAESAFRTLTACQSCSMTFRVNAAVVCAHTGDAGRAQDYLSEARRVASMWSDGPWHAAVAEADAALRLAQGAEPAVIIPLLEQARDGFRASHRERDAERCEQEAARLRGR